MIEGTLPGEWPRTVFVCPACGSTLADGSQTCADGGRGVAVEVVPRHEADFRPTKDPREQANWAQMTDEQRASAMAEYLSAQAAHEADGGFEAQPRG